MCGLYPWKPPGALPLVGTPIGRHQPPASPVCFDHISWFQAGLIANPSVLILGMTGLGKSTLTGKLAMGCAAQGYTLLVPGDTKPDYTALGQQLGCEIRTVKRFGGWALNPCDPGGMIAAAEPIGGQAGEELRGEAIGRAVTLLAALIELSRKGPVADYEESVLGAALRQLYEHRRGAGDRRPARADPQPAPGAVDRAGAGIPRHRQAIPARRHPGRYDHITAPLRRSLRALIGGKYGDVFARPTERRPLGSGVVIDTTASRPATRTSSPPCCSPPGPTPTARSRPTAPSPRPASPRSSCTAWCWMRCGASLELGGTIPERVNELTRLNRTDGVGQIMVSHSANDFQGTGSARTDGIAERAGAIVIGGVPRNELDRLDGLLTLTSEEKQPDHQLVVHLQGPLRRTRTRRKRPDPAQATARRRDVPHQDLRRPNRHPRRRPAHQRRTCLGRPADLGPLGPRRHHEQRRNSLMARASSNPKKPPPNRPPPRSAPPAASPKPRCTEGDSGRRPRANTAPRSGPPADTAATAPNSLQPAGRGSHRRPAELPSSQRPLLAGDQRQRRGVPDARSRSAACERAGQSPAAQSDGSRRRLAQLPLKLPLGRRRRLPSAAPGR